MEGLTAADVGAVTRNNMGYDGFGGNSAIWLIAILAMCGGFGWNNRNGYGLDGRFATTEDVAEQANFTRLESQNNSIREAIGQGFTNIGNGICQAEYQNLQNISALGSRLQDCCCEQKQIALENRYLSAQNTSVILQNQDHNTQKILDVISQNKIESLQAQVNKLQLDQAMCGVVRYPNGATYNAGGFPFGCGC